MGLLQDLKADYQRHHAQITNLAFWAVATYRIGRWGFGQPRPVCWLAGKLYGAMFLAVDLASNTWLHREAEIGKDFHLIHAGNTRIDPGAKIGDRVGIMHDVTIGASPDVPGVPVIGNDVFIGAGAKLLGPITVGDGARIAANSLVIGDVPAGATAIGVPARIMRYTGRPASGVESSSAAPRAD